MEKDHNAARSAAAAPGSLRLEPIGLVRNGLASKVQAARQPVAASGVPARIDLFPGRHFEHALDDLAGWERIWVVFWFHHNASWRPKVLPPRSTTGRKGVFATRSPHRPNPIGISAVRLERVEGLCVHILDADMIDGTPVLDLKPYVAYTDAYPGAGAGWLEEVARRGGGVPVDPVPAYQVLLEPCAAEQAQWIEHRTGLAISERVHETLMLGPEPHPYRRIRRLAHGMQLAIKEWRVRFSVAGNEIRVSAIDSGFRDSQLGPQAAESVHPHRDFLARWPRQ